MDPKEPVGIRNSSVSRAVPRRGYFDTTQSRDVLILQIETDHSIVEIFRCAALQECERFTVGPVANEANLVFGVCGWNSACAVAAEQRSILVSSRKNEVPLTQPITSNAGPGLDLDLTYACIDALEDLLHLEEERTGALWSGIRNAAKKNGGAVIHTRTWWRVRALAPKKIAAVGHQAHPNKASDTYEPEKWEFPEAP